jgi:tRNA-splicing ligase RtcB
MDRLGAAIPYGMGKGAVWHVDREELRSILVGGSRYAVKRGYGRASDLTHCEDGGAVDGADPDAVSDRAVQRGMHQVGSIGSGNHFVEVQVVDRVFDEEVAAAFGLAPDRVCVMIHTGSRGLGHQICTDQVRIMETAMGRYGLSVPDRQLACVPVESPEGRSYMGAMAAGANFGRANRQLLTHAARSVFADVIPGSDLELLYDVSHNLAKLEEHELGGTRRRLCVHRKGATLALPPGHPDLEAEYSTTGQPVMVPGSMGTASYVMAGVAGSSAFHSACHGAGRTLSRHAARKRVSGSALRVELEESGVAVRGASSRGLAEEAPLAYKDVDEVVEACAIAGLAAKVVRLVPIGVVKG